MAARVLSLSEILEEDESLDTKVNDLVNLVNHGFKVAESFIITHQGYLSFLKENNLESKIKHLVSLGLENQIEKNLKESRLPESLVKEILKIYRIMGTALDDVEVRVNGEKIKGDAALIEKVRQIFISSYPSKKVNIVIQKVHFGKHGKVRTSSKFINSINPFSGDEVRLLENMLSKFKSLFYLPHEIDFTLEKGKVIINKIKPETNVSENTLSNQDTGYKIIINSHY